MTLVSGAGLVKFPGESLPDAGIMPEVPNHYFTQSAVIPYRFNEGRMEVLLIGSRKNKRWVIPKGVKEPDLSASCSATREAFEEAGVEGRVSNDSIGSYRYRKWGGVCEVEVFALEVERVHEHWLENHRKRQWVSIKKAAAYVQEQALKELLLSLPDKLAE